MLSEDPELNQSKKHMGKNRIEIIPMDEVQMETFLLTSNALGQTDTKGNSIYIA